jgi:phosphatidylserine/phosphatidylglycerophosphate/cardiolipin synthase-like enzyme
LLTNAARSRCLLSAQGHTPILRALLDAAERGVQVVYTHGPLHAPVVRKEIAKFRALYYAAGGDTEKILAQAGRYTEVWQLGLALSRHPNFTSLCVCDGGLRNPGAAAAVRAASGLPALPTIAGSSHPGVGNTPWLLHSKLTVVDCERFTTGSANHVDISMERTQDCGHTELNDGVQGQAATREVLRKLLGFLLVDEWDTTMLDDGAGGREQQAAREVATALAERGVANRARWECGEPVVGRVVETDWEWYYLRAKVDGGKHDELALFEGWAAGAAAAGM